MVRKEKSNTLSKKFEDYEDALDFEPENDKIDQENSSLNDSQFISSDDCKSEESEENSFVTGEKDDLFSSVSHRGEMIPILKDYSADDRQEYYLKNETPTNSQILLDSSTDSGGSDSEIIMDGNDSDVSSTPLTAEEENKYLLSDDEEIQVGLNEEDNLFRNKQVSYNSHNLITIAIPNKGNNNIITETITGNKKSDNLKSNTLEREQIVKRESTLRRGKKRKSPSIKKSKRSWDVTSANKCDTPQLFLNDIGCENNDDENRETGSVDCNKEIAEVTRIKITCGENRKRICEKIVSKSISPRPIDETFKVPLPPVKRPPSRPKKQHDIENFKNLKLLVKNDVRQFLNNKNQVQSKSNNKDIVTREDDEISIAASSLAGGNISALEHQEDLNNSSSVFNEQYSMEFEREADETLLNKTKFTRNWIEKTITSSEMPESASFQENNLSLPTLDITDNTRVNFRSVSPFFLGLCYHHYFNNHCYVLNCKLPHNVNVDKFTAKTKTLSTEELKQTYTFTLPFPLLYEDMYMCFVYGFAKKNMRYEMVDCINDFFEKNINVFEAVDLVIQQLKKTGMNYCDAVELISLRIGLTQYPTLADVLMDILSKSVDIESNWKLIKKLLHARGKISPSTVKRICRRATSVLPLNKDVCLDIYNTIIKDKKTDTSGIEDDLLPLKKFVLRKENTAQLSRTPSYSYTVEHNENDSDYFTVDRLLHPENTRFEDPNHPKQHEVLQTAKRVVDFNTRTVTSSYQNSSNSHSDEGYSDDRNTNEPESSSYNLRSRSPSPSPSNISESQSSTMYIPKHISPLKRQVELNDLSIQLFPAKPIIGKSKYGKNFQLDISLHNLLTTSPKHQVPIHQQDILKLNSAIYNGKDFLELLERNKNVVTIYDFVSMTIATLKSNNQMIEILFNLIDSVSQHKPDFEHDLFMKIVFEVIVMNILLELEKNIQWELAATLIEKFCDWDSLVSSKIFSSRKITHMGRYLFLAKMLVKGKSFLYTYDILDCPGLHLLESPADWPYFCKPEQELKYRNSLLTEIFKVGYNYNIAIVLELYKKEIFGYESNHFDSMMEKLIDSKKITSLSCIYGNIEEFYERMNKDILREFTLLMLTTVTMEERMKLYELCCEKEIYFKYSGMEKNIIIRTNMPDAEIEFILEYFLFKISHLECDPYVNVTIQITLPQINNNGILKPLKYMIRSVRDLNMAVKNILKQQFRIEVAVNDTKLTEVTIPSRELKLFILQN